MRPWARAAFWIVVAGQLLFLLGFIAFQEMDLRTGTEVVLQTVPVDPRSLLQGDYVILDYEIAALPERLQDTAKGTPVFVVLSEGAEVWEAENYRTEAENYRTFPPSPSHVFIKGRVDRPGHLDFGIGTYFVPEGTGGVIERAEDVKVKVAVDADGSVIIREVLVDGRPFVPDVQPEN